MALIDRLFDRLLDEQLKRLGIGTVDYYLLHSIGADEYPPDVRLRLEKDLRLFAILALALGVTQALSPFLALALGGLYHGYRQLRNRKVNEALVQGVETARAVLTTTPQGQAVDAQFVKWLMDHGALLNRPGAGRIEVPEEMAPGELRVTLDDMLAHARTQAPALAREQKVVERSDLAANLARKSYYPDYTVSGGYFNQGGLPPMWQFRVDFKLPAWLGKQRAEVGEQVFTASQARHDYEAADVGIQAGIREEYTLAATSRAKTRPRHWARPTVSSPSGPSFRCLRKRASASSRLTTSRNCSCRTPSRSSRLMSPLRNSIRRLQLQRLPRNLLGPPE